LTDTNYKELQSMYQRLGPKGFVVLGFPCNQFGGQEPGTPAEIKAFTDGYGVTFPLFSKVDVNGPNTHPLFAYLKKQKGELLGDDIKWNFVSPQLLAALSTAATACPSVLTRLRFTSRRRPSS
jgi:glutathione peroxidase-family protein